MEIYMKGKLISKEEAEALIGREMLAARIKDAKMLAARIKDAKETYMEDLTIQIEWMDGMRIEFNI